jgi:hypothetical protein
VPLDVADRDDSETGLSSQAAEAPDLHEHPEVHRSFLDLGNWPKPQPKPIRDPFGHRFHLNAGIEGLTPTEQFVKDETGQCC